jgi:hypothetical protein
MADEDAIEPCCVEAPYCKLCYFPLEDGELAVAGGSLPYNWFDGTLLIWPLAIRVDRVSATFSFRCHDIFEDDEEGIAICLCCGGACLK